MPIPNKSKVLTIFSPDQLHKIVTETLPPDAKPGEKVVVATIDQQGAKVAASFTKTTGPANWRFEAAARHDWSGDNAVGANVILRFP